MVESDNKLSGEYRGYYAYRDLTFGKHEMSVNFFFADDNKLSGRGIDDINSFTVLGEYNLETGLIYFDKHYHSHVVQYTGSLQSTGSFISINGIWTIKSAYSQNGKFMLNKNLNQAQIAADIETIENKLFRQVITHVTD